MLIRLLLIIYLLGNCGLMAQERQLFCTNLINQDTIVIKSKALVKFEYKGYRGQAESCYGVINLINDSIIEIERIQNNKTDMRTLYIKDITGFRKFHKSRLYLLPAAQIGIAASSLLLFYAWQSNLNWVSRAGISVGYGIVGSGILKVAFGERVKYKTKYGWVISVR